MTVEVRNKQTGKTRRYYCVIYVSCRDFQIVLKFPKGNVEILSHEEWELLSVV